MRILLSSQSYIKRVVNIQMGGGPAATTFRKDKLKKVSQHNMSCVDSCASAFTEIPDMCVMCTRLKRASKNMYKMRTD